MTPIRGWPSCSAIFDVRSTRSIKLCSGLTSRLPRQSRRLRWSGRLRYPLCPPDGLKLAYTVNEVRKLVGVSTATNYKLLGSGALKAVKLGNRTLVLAKDLRDWLERLPPRRRQLAKFLNLQ